MQALWLENRRLSFREDAPMPEPKPGEALVRVRLAGICGTDLELTRGYYPFAGIPGHEFAGEVVSAPDREWIGRRVVGEINIACGECRSCLDCRPQHCERRAVLGIKGKDGAFAEYLSLPAANLHAVPQNVPDEAAVFVEPLAAALRIQQQIPVRLQDRVLLIGTGRLGQLIAQTLALTGCDLQALARRPRQRELLKARGIRVIDEGAVETRAYDIVVEASGAASGFELARRAVRPRGALVLKSTWRGTVSLDLSALAVDEIMVVGSRCGPFDQALRLLEQGAVDPSALVDAVYPLREGVEAFAKTAELGALKVLLRPFDPVAAASEAWTSVFPASFVV
jgi:threonine dehydrogenase-like Zn-dependent dehydrogenase